MRSLRHIATLVFVLAFAAPAMAGTALVPQRLYQEADSAGTARAVVRLNVATSLEGHLPNALAVAAQRRAIGRAQGDIRRALAGRFHRLIWEYRSIPFVALEGSRGALAALEQAPMVAAVYEDKLYHLSLPQSVPLIKADQAWVQGFDGTGSMVAILDTGVDKLHPFLAGKVIEEACYSGNSNCPNGATQQIGSGAGVPCTYSGSCWHGTHVAGIAAGAGTTINGVARGASVMAVQVFSRFTGAACTGTGQDPCALAYTSDILAGMQHVYDLRDTYRIAAVNLSLGGETYSSTAACDADSPAEKAMIDTLRAAGIATVVAAGNDGTATALSSPACISTAVSVGSTTKADAISSFSNAASFLSMLAPGSSIQSSIPGGGFGVASGTSMATPHVAGAWAVLKQKNPGATVIEVLDALVTTGVLLTDSRNGVTKPRIDVAEATAAIQPPVPPATIPPTGAITINRNAAVTPATEVTLNLWATDAVGVTGYYLSTSSTPPAPAAPGWVAVTSTTSFAANVPYTLSGGNGTKTVYAWYKDAADNVSATASDSIVLDPAVNNTGSPPAIALQQVATNLARPVAMAHAGDGSGRLFIALQAGKIVIFDGTQVLPTPFLDINPPPPAPAKVLCCDEQGLLGLAFHPNYAANGFFYVYYTNPAAENVVARYSVSATNPNLADPASEEILLSVPNPFDNHNGGQIKFGPDGYLYIAKGDGGSGGDPGNRAQNLNELLGKILRIDVDGTPPYAIPPTNPFIGTAGARPEIWVYGVRNPWRFTFDRVTGDLWIADVGQDVWEEVDLQLATSPGGENYGWRRMEGPACYNPSTNCNDGTLTLPIIQYAQGSGDCSITGGYRYRGTQIPGLAGQYLYADYCSGRLWAARPDGGAGWTSQLLLDTPHAVSTFGEDQAGELYLAHRANTMGAIYRIVGVNTAPTLAFTGEAGYTADGVEPDAGSSSTNFTFRVKYTDADGDAPLGGYPKVHILQGGAPIGGSPFAMTFVSGTPSSGAIYTYSSTLAVGSYTYRFEAFDSNNAAATGPPTSSQAGPTVSSTPPSSPTSLTQFQSNSTTAIPVGGSTSETTVIFKGGVSDPDAGQQVKLQVEVRPVGTAFINTPTHESGLVNSGATAQVTATSFANGSYHWQARTMDSAGAPSAWVAFGGNAESAADFAVAPACQILFSDDFNRPDSASLGPNWTVLAGTWAIQGNQLAQTSTTSGTKIVRTAAALAQADYQVQAQVIPLTGQGYAGIVARLASSSSYYLLRLRVDQGTVALLRNGTTFLGNSFTPPGGLTLGTTYGLRLTVQGAQITGEFSADGGTTWVPVASVVDSSLAGPGFAGVLGSNSTLRAENFSVTAVGCPPPNQPPASPTSLTQFRSNGTTAIPVGGSTSETTVIFKGGVSDPDAGQQVKLQVEVRPVGTAFTNTPTHESGLVNSGATAQVTATSFANGSYHWQARTMDSAGAPSAWVAFGGNAESAADFAVSASTSLFSDDFNRPDSSSLGPNWTVLSGSWAVQTNQLALTAAASGAQIARTAAALPQANYQVQSQVIPLSGVGYAGILARLVNSTNYYMLRLRVDQGTVALLRGPNTFLGAPYTVPGGLVFGTTYALRLTASGSQIAGEFSPDGGTTWVPVASVADATYAGPGSAGVLGSNSTARWDDFVVIGQ